MNDEKYVYEQDVRQKASTARSARKRRTHAGKGGTVKFPSDFMTKKELQSMNGEVKSWRLNEPMSWAEFKSMPDDIRVVYIKALRSKYGVSDSKLAEMFGAKQVTASKEMRRLGLGLGRAAIKVKPFDSEGWFAFCNGIKIEKKQAESDSTVMEETEQSNEPEPNHTENAIPCTGSLTFEGTAESALKFVCGLLGGANVRISVSWELCDNG